MKTYAVLEITGGADHSDMCEERSDNLMEHRSAWNVTFQLEGQGKPYCMATKLVTRVVPEDQIFSPAIIKTLQRTRRRRGRRRWWKNLIEIASQIEDKELTDNCTVWRLVGRPHMWPVKCDDAVVFIEYDAHKQHGYAIIITYCRDLTELEARFPTVLHGCKIAKDDEELLYDKW